MENSTSNVEDPNVVNLERKNKLDKEIELVQTNLDETKTNQVVNEIVLDIEKINYDHDHHKNTI